MVKIISVVFLLVLTTKLINAQNLIPNPSFEESKGCQSKIYTLNNWFQPSGGTTDYFKKCRNKINNRIFEICGITESNDGDAFIGMIVFAKPPGIEMILRRNYREYIAVNLYNEIKTDSLYEISFNIKIADLSDYCIEYIQLVLTPEFPNKNGDGLLKYDKNSTVLTVDIDCQSSEWQLFKTQFKGHGGEKYLIVGNFKNLLQSKVLYRKDLDINIKSNGHKDCYIYLDSFNLVKISSEKERAKTPRKL